MAAISFEYFPPKTAEQKAVFERTHDILCTLNPGYFSVTFGAGGSTITHTEKAVLRICQDPQLQVAPHISCLGGTAEEIRHLLHIYRQAGVKRLVALRGDMPSGMASAGEFRFANELVAFIRAEMGDHFHIHVACYPEFHPESQSSRCDLDNFKRKVAAGADEAITQYFFNIDAYFRFVDDSLNLGIDIPIVPGIMPITNYAQLARFSSLCGAEIPRWLRHRLQDFGEDRKSLRAFGVDVISDLCRRLLEGGAPGLHFYTLNRATAVRRIYENLNFAGDG